MAITVGPSTTTSGELTTGFPLVINSGVVTGDSPSTSVSPSASVPSGFKIYYKDSVYSSKDGKWEKAPSHGVLIVTVYFDKTYQCRHTDHWETHNYRNILHGALAPINYYLIINGTIHGGLVEEIPEGASVKEGETVDSDLFYDILNRATREERWL